MKKEVKTTNKVCADCIHLWACSAWNIGSLNNTNARHCTNFETKDDLVEFFLKKGST